MSAKTMIDRRITKAVKRNQREDRRRQEAEERNRRGREREFLARAIGMHILNELERHGVVHIRSYLRVYPKSVINWYQELTNEP